ncbi:hypothetical protein FB451DRAFT_1257630, partial [Mycena latifolia]
PACICRPHLSYASLLQFFLLYLLSSFLSFSFPLSSSFSFSSLFSCYLLLHLISLLPLLHLLSTAASTHVLFLIACIACTYRRTNPTPLPVTYS